MPQPEPVLICALSGRALAQAARAAGYAPIVLDAFGDLDTRDAAAAWRRIPVNRRWLLCRRPLLAAATRLAPPPIPLVWGSGFERAPSLLEELATGRSLWGNDSATVRSAKDPSTFASVANSLGVPHPETRLILPRPAAGWLGKRAGAAGGGHVRPAGGQMLRGRGWYWQRRARGEPCSALVVGNGREARTLALGRQLLAPAPGRPFRFGGTVAPAEVSVAAYHRAAEAAAALAACYAVRGLVSVDMLVDGEEIVALEINPRPGASLDAYRCALSLDLFSAHVAGCRGEDLPEIPETRTVGGSLIVHAHRTVLIPRRFTWPEWTADRSPPGTRIPAGGPVCTVLAEGGEHRLVERDLRARAEWILAACVETGGVSRKAPCLEPA
ncbi:MAG: ATP-grasp domain-containing protein [Geminicoccaceae bacterium]